MSLKSFVSGLLHKVAHLFALFVPKFKLAVHWSAEAMQSIKTFDHEHPEVADLFTSIIPGKLDDAAKDKLRVEIPKIAVELKLVDAQIAATNDPTQIVLAMAKEFPKLTERARNVFTHGMQVLMSQVLADQKLTWQDAVLAGQYYYEEKLKKNEPIDVDATIEEVKAEEEETPAQ